MNQSMKEDRNWKKNGRKEWMKEGIRNKNLRSGISTEKAESLYEPRGPLEPKLIPISLAWSD